MDKRERMEELVSALNRASDAYYGGRGELMSNFEWDAGFDELTALEAELGDALPDSPTRRVGTEEEEGRGTKERHEFPPLSLRKTKEVPELQKWAGDRPVWLSWKLDGLTLVLTYDGGTLSRILTRGNGNVGTNISFMRDAIRGIPANIDYPGHLVVRGEATISYTDFELLNEAIEDGEKYANPRNLAAGTLALDIARLEEVGERRVRFLAFTLVHSDEAIPSWGAQMERLDRLGFTTVARERTDAEGLPEAVTRWTKQVETGAMDLPVDGLVICYDDTEYAAGGSVTGHHATRAGYAFKWEDASALTRLDHVEWSCAASTITPVAVFDPVLLEGTTVTRASLHNISEMERLGIGADGRTTLEVIKANKIIPKCIAVKSAEGRFEVPAECPVCRAETRLQARERSAVKTLHCTNPACPAKHVKRFARFVSKQGMDIDGLSIKTLLKLINLGCLAEFADIYRLENHAEAITTLEGFGERSWENLRTAIARSRRVHPVNLLYALCIPMIGIDAGKKLVRALGYPGLLERLESETGFADIDGIGPERSNAIIEWYRVPENERALRALLAELTVEGVEASREAEGSCKGVIFVITGELRRFRNRDAFRAYVEGQGGSVTGSVSKKTGYLVNNEPDSDSAKNRKAKTLGVPILSEEDFIARFGGVE